MVASSHRSRLPVVLLNVLFPGAGLAYSGRVARGTVIAGASALAALAWMVTWALAPLPEPVLWIGAGAAMLLLQVALVVTVLRSPRTDAGTGTRLWPALGLVIAGGLLITYGGGLFVERLHLGGASMEPSLPAGASFLVIKGGPRARLERGAIVVHEGPHMERTRMVHRVIGLEGDRIEVAGTDVVVNGQSLQHEPCPGGARGCVVEQLPGAAPYRVQYADRRPDQDPGRFTLLVPAGHFFVMGDNRDESWDGRHFGPVHVSRYVGRVLDR